MNLNKLPYYITHVRRGKTLYTRRTDRWDDDTFPSIAAAKRFVRLDLKCKGGPRSPVRTAESLDLK